MANAEILSISLLMEDVLLSGFVEKSVFLHTGDFPAPDAGGGVAQRRGSMSRRMSISTPTRSVTSLDRKGSGAGKRMSDAERRTSDVGG